MLPLSNKGTGTQPLVWPPAAFVGVVFCCVLFLVVQDCFGRAAFRDYLLNTLRGEQGSQSLITKIIGKGPYFPAASQLRTMYWMECIFKRIKSIFCILKIGRAGEVARKNCYYIICWSTLTCSGRCSASPPGPWSLGAAASTFLLRAWDQGGRNPATGNQGKAVSSDSGLLGCMCLVEAACLHVSSGSHAVCRLCSTICNQ